jgi:hypothetical protein
LTVTAHWLVDVRTFPANVVGRGAGTWSFFFRILNGPAVSNAPEGWSGTGWYTDSTRGLVLFPWQFVPAPPFDLVFWCDYFDADGSIGGVLGGDTSAQLRFSLGFDALFERV